MMFCTHSRKLLLGLVCALFILWLNGTQSSPAVKTASPATPATLQGAAALEQLKQTGQYTSLQAAMKQARLTVSHASTTLLGHAAWHAPNRGAGYDAYVHEDGVSLVLDKSTPVSLRLCGLGYGADWHDVAAGTVSGAQQTINIDRGVVREWYVNSAEGLEQGFTLNAPPAEKKLPDAKLWLALQLNAGQLNAGQLNAGQLNAGQLNTGWRAVPSADGQRVSLLHESGALLEYGKLAAWDAQGQILPATLAVEDERIVIEVDDAQAIYPLTIDPIFTQQTKLTAPDAAASDLFGFAVALDGNTAAVGAPFDDAPGADQGSVYVFVRNGMTWMFQAKLLAMDGAAGDQFGNAVALGGDTLVIGANLDDSGGNANQGSAYVFTRSGTSWSPQQKLTDSDGAANDGFGFTVALNGDTVVVGALADDIGANGNQGSAYVFVCPACPTIALSPASLPNAHIGASYNQAVTASGGTGPYQFSLSGGALPPGISLSQIGFLTGMPTTTGTYSFTITATILSSLCSGSRTYTLIVTPPCPTITVNPTNSTLPNGRAGVFYSQTFTQTGGAGTATFSVSTVQFPAGLTMAANGVLSGTPTVSGTFSLTVHATDANGCVGQRSYTLLLLPLCPAITLNPTTLPNGFVGMAYNQTLTATGGTAPYTFIVAAGTLPNGLTLTTGGVLSGTLTVPAMFNFTVAATDNSGCTGVRAYTVTVSGNGLMFYPLVAPVRLLDTRPGASPNACSQPNAPITGGTAAHTTRTQLLFDSGECGGPDRQCHDRAVGRRLPDTLSERCGATDRGEHELRRQRSHQ